MKNPLPLKAPWWAEFRTLLITSKFIIFMRSPYINFLKYYENFFAIGSAMLSRIQNTFQIVEACFFAAGIDLLSKILWKIILCWKRHDEQNSENFSECRRVLFWCSRQIIIFYDIKKNALPLEASWWKDFRTLFIMSKGIIFMQSPYLIF